MLASDGILLDETAGQWVMIWSVRLSLTFYVTRVLVILHRDQRSGVPSARECWLWALGCLFYIIHVTTAFDHVHGWSHRLAWEHTADVTEQMTGISRGDGIWVNYLFTAVWTCDVLRICLAHKRGRATRRGIDMAMQCFFAFIVFNATLVFGPDIYRWLFPLVAVLLIWSWRHRQYRRRAHPGHHCS